MELDDAIGLSSKHALQRRPITKEELVSPVLVGRDQPVMIVYQSAGITASMPGVALKNGRKGEMVKVRNASSQRVIQPNGGRKRRGDDGKRGVMLRRRLKFCRLLTALPE